MKRLGFSPIARADLLAIGLYIAEGNPERAEEVRIVRVLHGARDLTRIFGA